MITDDQIIRLILGFKVRYLRLQKGFSYQELAKITGLSISYLNDIEKGKRYPKPDKITAIATALDVDYNYMVALNASKKLQPIIDLLTSKFFKLFPLKEFGLSMEKTVELFTQTPDRVNAFISTLFKIARNYQVDEAQFYKEALRSYQDMHNNYFPELEEATQNFKKYFSIDEQVPYTTSFLEEQLNELYNIKVDRTRLSSEPILKTVRSYYEKDSKTLFLRNSLHGAQENFLIARELGYQFLNIKERPYETTILNIDSFDTLLNYYKASHFAAALLMDEHNLVADIKKLTREINWRPNLFLDLLKKYNVTAEMLLQRLTNILPHHFGLEDLFFIKLTGSKDLSSFHMSKNLHLSKLHNPYNNELAEKYCRRWVSIRSIQNHQQMGGQKAPDSLIADAQISKYWKTESEYLCISIVKEGSFSQDGVSVTIGLLINDRLKGIFNFLSDPKLTIKEVHTTCQRCGIIDCESRAAPPTILEEMKRRDDTTKTLKNLK